MQGNESTQNGVIRVRVSDLLFALQKRWMIIVALSLVGLTFGMILSAMTVVQTSYQTYNVNGSFAVSSKNINGQYVGGSFKCAPRSVADDGLIDVCLIKPISRKSNAPQE